MSEVKVDVLKQLRPFCELATEEIKHLIPQTKIISLEFGDRIQASEYSDSLLYLLDGKVAFFHNISSQHVLTATDAEAKKPLFSGPTDVTGYYLEAIYGSEILLISKSHLDHIIFNELFTDSTTDSPRDIETSLYHQIEHAINSNNLSLPSLPEIALRVKTAIKKESNTAHDMENIIESDMVMALRLVQIANGPLIRGSVKIDSLRDAIVRIGITKTHDLVISLAISQLFKSNSTALKKQMINLYIHSIEIAAISYALAEQFSSINAEKLLLAGLLHDIGTIPVLTYIEKNLIDIDEEFQDEAELQMTIKKLSPSIGSMIISKWGLPKEIIPVIEETEMWHRNESDEIDMCDIVNVAHILSLYKKDQASLIPHIETTPCFQKLFPGSSRISDCDEVLKQAAEKIYEIKNLINTQ